MTVEEAIKWLEYSKQGEIGKAVEAADMAIKALSQQTEEAISRQAAIEKIHWLGFDNDTAIKCDLAIRALPPVNPQPKTGHWIERPEIKTSAPEYLMFYECSECGDKQCF